MVCDWHTVNDAVLAYGEALVDHPHPDRRWWRRRVWTRPSSVGEEEWCHQSWSTSLDDVLVGQLLDVVEGREAAPSRWLAARGEE